MNHIRLFDCHCDTISRIYDQGGTLQKNDYHISLEKAQCFSRYAQIFAIWGDSSTDQNIEGRFRAQMELAHTLLDGKNGAPMLCRNAKEIKRAYASGHNAAFLSAEGAELLGCSEKTLEQAYNDGLRFLVLTWNNRNLCACSAAADESEGLTLHGRNFVKTADEIGIILDVSHLSQRGFFEIDEIVKRPFIASHSNSRAVYEHRRNLTNEQLRILIHRGGICGINLYTEFLTSKLEKCSIDTIVRHIDHILSIGGEHILALGCDFDGCDSLPDGIESISDLTKLYDALIKRNYKKSLIDNIFYGNMSRFIEKNLN